jgi:hypothetical protein
MGAQTPSSGQNGKNKGQLSYKNNSGVFTEQSFHQACGNGVDNLLIKAMRM